MALLGFVLFVGGSPSGRGRSGRACWRTAPGSAVASYFPHPAGRTGFTGSRYLLGEFGWLGAAGMLVLGVGFVWWHFRTPTKDGLSPKEPTGYQSSVMWLWFRNSAKLKAPAAAT